jgi:hypothetical protein
LRLAEIRNGFFGFLARVFDSWAAILRPRIENAPARKDPFVSTPHGPPAHWLELTAGLSFTEMDAGQDAPEALENETRDARPQEDPPEASAVEEAPVRESLRSVSESGEDAAPVKPEAKSKRSARKQPSGSALTFHEGRPRDAKEAPGTSIPPAAKKSGASRIFAEGFLSLSGPEPEHFSREIPEIPEIGETTAAKFDPPGKNTRANEPAQNDGVVPVLSRDLSPAKNPPARAVSSVSKEETPARAEDPFLNPKRPVRRESSPPRRMSPLPLSQPQPPGISQHENDNVFAAVTSRKSERVPDQAFAAAEAGEKGSRSRPAAAAGFPGVNSSGDHPAAESFIGHSAANRFPEISAVAPVKAPGHGGAAVFPDNRKQPKPREFDRPAAVPVPARPENGFGHGFVGRGDQEKNFPALPAIDGNAKWADLPELDLGGAAGAPETDHLRRKHLAELEREQKGERWSV